MSDARPDRSATHAGTRLFDFFKEETIRGFYTSRLGLQELDSQKDSFYGQSPGCAHDGDILGTRKRCLGPVRKLLTDARETS